MRPVGGLICAEREKSIASASVRVVQDWREMDEIEKQVTSSSE